jgi:hypothetical protein|tara:strand:- start:1302 stop:1490 length:189 start_codon:yes stop_codon:yes gene_type:complete
MGDAARIAELEAKVLQQSKQIVTMRRAAVGLETKVLQQSRQIVELRRSAVGQVTIKFSDDEE